MMETKRCALIWHVHRPRTQQIDQPRQHRPERAALQPRAMCQRNDRGLRGIRCERAERRGRGIVVGLQWSSSVESGACIAGFARGSNVIVAPAKAGAHTPWPRDFERSELILFVTIKAGGYGSLLFAGTTGSFSYAAFFGALRRRKRPSRRRLPLRGIRSTSLTSLAPPLRRSSTILRLWNASSSARWATLTMVAFGNSLITISIILSWLFSSSAEVASSSTTMSGLCSSSRAKASRCFSPPDKVWSH